MSENAWIDAKILDAYGSWDVGPGTARGCTFGYCFGKSGRVERWWTSRVGFEADKKDAEAGKTAKYGGEEWIDGRPYLVFHTEKESSSMPKDTTAHLA